MSATTPKREAPPVTPPEARQRVQDLKLAAQLDRVREELRNKTREAKELQLQVATKDRRLEELQRKLEEVTADRREAFRRAEQAESERDGKRQLLHQKEQELQAAQKKLEHLKTLSEERSRAFNKREEELRLATLEVQRLRVSIDVLQERLASSERELKQVEQGQSQQKRANEDLHSGLKAHIEVIEEQLGREASRRRELEDRCTIEVRHRVEEGALLSQERERAEGLERRVREMQAELAGKATAALEQAQQRRQLEEAHAEQELALKEECSQQLSAARSRVAELEEQRSVTTTQCQTLERKVKEAEQRAVDLVQDLAEERDRADGLEQQLARLEERVSKLVEKAAQEAAHHPAVTQLERQLAEAEAEAIAARDELLRWRDWADEQSLRELTAETARLEELKQVREDVTRQVEEARRGALEDMQRRILELEKESDTTALHSKLAEQERLLKTRAESLEKSEQQLLELRVEVARARRAAEDAEVAASDLREDLQDAERRHAEKLRDLETRAARAEASAAVASDELLDERERLQKEAATTLRAQVAESRWHVLTQQVLARSAQQSARSVWAHVVEAASRRPSRSHVQLQPEDFSKQEKELEQLDKENEELREQNKEVLLSLLQQQQELRIALVEMQRLQERETAHEEELLRAAERTAELGGHGNLKQKIKHVVSLKDENQSLRQDLKRAKQQVAQLEGQLRCAHFLEDTLTRPGPTESGSTVGGRQKEQRRQQSSAATTATTLGSGRDSAESTSRSSELLRRERAERRSSERAMVGYHHLLVLVDRALAPDLTASASTLATTAPSSGTATPIPGTETDVVGSGLDARLVLKRLRELPASLSAAGCWPGAGLGPAPVTSRSGGVEELKEVQQASPKALTEDGSPEKRSPKRIRDLLACGSGA